MRIAAVADLHGNLPATPECDLLILAGDCITHPWDNFERWLREQPAGDIVGIAGNHDFVAEDYPELMRKLPWIYLQDEEVILNGVTIYGSPWTPMFFDWAFMKEDPELEEIWARIPDDTDILVTHGPPWGMLDLTHRGANAGSMTLARRLGQIMARRNGQPGLIHIFGHIHEGAGMFRDEFSGAEFRNVAYINFMGGDNAIQVFDL